MRANNFMQMLHVIITGHQEAISAIDFDKTFIVTGSHDHTLQIYERTNFIVVHTLIGHERSVNCLQFHSGIIVSGSSDKTVR